MAFLTSDFTYEPTLDNLATPAEHGPDRYEQAVTPFDTSPPRLDDDEARTIKRRIEISRLYQEKEFNDEAKQSTRLWEGRHYRNATQKVADLPVVVNYTLPTVQTRVDRIAFGYADFYAHPLTEEAEEPSKVAIAALKYWWEKISAQELAIDCCQDMEVYGYGVMYIGWLVQTKKFKSTTGFDTGQGDPSLTGGTDPVSDPPIDLKDLVENRPYLCRIDPRRFFVDPACGKHLEDAKWCGYWEIWDLETLKNDSRFQHTAGLKGTSKDIRAYLDASYHGKTEEEIPADVKTIKLWHYFEKNRRLHLCMVEESEEILLAERFDWWYNRYPFQAIHGPCLASNWYGMSTPMLMEDMQQELNEVRTQMSRHRRRANRKLITQAGNLSPFSRKALTSSEDLAIVETTNNQPVNVVPPLTIQPEVLQADSWAKTDINAVTKVSSYDTASPPTFRKTNDEASFIQQGGSASTQADAVRFERFLEGIARDIVDLLMQYPVQTRSLPIYDDSTHARSWVTYGRDYIQGDYLIYIYAGSTQPESDPEKVRVISNLLNALGPYVPLMAQGTVPPAIQLLLAQLLQSVPYIRNTEKIIQSLSQGAPPPQGAPGPPGGNPPPAAAPPPPPQGVTPELLGQLLQYLMAAQQPGGQTAPEPGLPSPVP